MATLGYVVIFPSTLAYLFFNRGLALIGPNRAAPFFHLVPVFGSAMAILLLGEQLRLFHLVGYALVLAGRGDRLAAGLGDGVRRLERVLRRGVATGFRFDPRQASLPANRSKDNLRKRPYVRALQTVPAPRRGGTLMLRAGRHGFRASAPIRTATSRWCCRSPPAAAPTPRRA